MKILISIACILTFGISVFGQIPLANNDVVELAKLGLGSEIIIAKIRASETKFDTSPVALKNLSDAKVPDSVIVAMVEKEQSSQKKNLESQEQYENTKNSIAEQGTLKDIVGKNKVFILVNDVESRDRIAKQLAKSDLTIVDKIEDSNFSIIYEDYVEEIGATVSVYGNTANAQPRYRRVGTLTVIMPGQSGNRKRLIYSSTKIEFWRWDDHPAKSTTKQFLKDLSKNLSVKE